MKRKILCLVNAALLTLVTLLSGCEFKLFKSADELYARPQLPRDYQELENTIKTVKSSLTQNGMSAENLTPLSGINPSAVQLLDLDGDGRDESAAAFFRVATTDESASKPLQIYIFSREDDGKYAIACVLEGEGNNIDSIYYEDLDGDGQKEIIVGWQLTTRVNVLSVYALGGAEPAELIHATYNESYALVDLNDDGCKEVVVIQRDDSGESLNRAEYYCYQEGVLTMTSSAALSQNVLDVLTVRSGQLSDGVSALYVTSSCEGGQVTDVFACLNRNFTNVTLNPESRVSNDTLRDYTDVSATDINRDGVLEIPVALALPRVSGDSAVTYRVIYWRQFDSAGKSAVACLTYHSVDSNDSGWYLVLPGDWDGQIMVERDDSEYYRGERAVVFYHREETGEPQPFLTIYKLTGSNRNVRAAMGEREILWSDEESVVYAAEFTEGAWDCGLNMSQLKARFNRYVKEWSTT